ncbi:MAG: MBL fold metallo-hydrolase [Fimbriimonadaceae bacterium]
MADPPPSLTFLSVGQGDCAVIQVGGQTILIDAGPATESFDSGARLIAPKLREMGVSRIDLVLVSHPDSDHIGGLPGIAQFFPIDRVAAMDRFRNGPDLIPTLERARIPETSVLWLKSGHKLTMSGATMAIDGMEADPESSDNAGSMIVHLRIGKSSAVFTGDAPDSVERWLAEKGGYSAQVMKAGHHGSRSSTSSDWLAEVRPRWVVFSAGRNNPFGHPSPDALGRAEAFGAEVLRTDRDGDIRFVATGRGFALVPGGVSSGLARRLPR